MLATMDSAVITLLLAEWALFALLKKLGVEPDAFLGCSTGEFAALTMCEAIDLFQSAELFYQLSTDVSRSINLSELSELRSVRVSASFDDVIFPILSDISGKIYMSADMSDSCVLLSGSKSVMDELCKQLKSRQIDYLILPVAIPYHTSLVAGKVSHQNADVQKLKMLPPRIESWSCSTESEYPNSADALRKISTGLFEKPIRLRSTVLKMYDAGTRIFVELGPKGGLVPYISEVLAGQEHLALAVNLAARTGIDQLNAMLAVLSCNGVELNLAALYERRINIEPEAGRVKQFFAAEEVSDYFTSGSGSQGEMSLELGMDLHRSDDFENETLQMSNSLYEFMQWSQPNYNPHDVADMEVPNAEWAPFFAGAGLSDEIMITYLSTMQQFHNSLMNTQERLMMAYLLGTPEEASEYDSYGRAGEFPFFPNAVLQTYDDCFMLEFSLSTLLQPFLLDHAIGGSVRTNSNGSSAVHLLPLMVALEIMAEGASLLYPHLHLIRITDVRAYKRIRVNSKILRLTLELRANTANIVDARICMQDNDQDDSSLLASCQVEFSQDYPLSPSPSEFPVQDQKASQLSPAKL
ncbi:MAG: acyltransferase domain-containing protein, partial [Candidatus Obscuribacterales bacterium]|nr:acyltransferase domain-containing protein [Candidatus Obscuribacterales bacterium]